MKKETHIKKKLEELEHQLIKTNTNQREETDKNNLQTQLDNINENKINGILLGDKAMFAENNEKYSKPFASLEKRHNETKINTYI